MPSVVHYVRVKEGESDGSVSKKLDRLINKSGILAFIRPGDFTAVKLHFGDKGNTGHIKSAWVKSTLSHVKDKTANAFLTDSNVIYQNSSRTNTIDHLKIAYEHGFSFERMGIPALIADGLLGRNFREVDIGKKHFSKVKIAADIADSDGILCLSHATGHIQTGYAGAIKNLAMGCASRRGKYEQHCGANPKVRSSLCTACGLCVVNCPADAVTLKDKKVSLDNSACIGCGECAVVCRSGALEIRWNITLEKLQQKMVEYAYGALKAVKGKAAYINFLIKITKNCDCLAEDEPRIVDDFGILASSDPVSIDAATMELLNKNHGKDFLKPVYKEIDWSVQLRYASEIGLGSLDYDLVEA